MAGARNELESLWAPNRWLLPDSAAGEGPKFNPDERLKEISGVRLIAATDEKPKSAYIKSLDAKLRSEDTPCKLSLLSRLDAACHTHVLGNSPDEFKSKFEATIMEDMLPPKAKGKEELEHKVRRTSDCR